MAKRTLRDARKTFDEVAAGLNPEMYRRLQKELDTASASAVTLATRYADEHVNDVLGGRDDVLRNLTELRDAYTALAAEAQAGDLSAADVNERLTKLRQQQRQLDRHGAEVSRVAELVERIEDDPEGWADETFYEKYPHMTPDFSF